MNYKKVGDKWIICKDNVYFSIKEENISELENIIRDIKCSLFKYEYEYVITENGPWRVCEKSFGKFIYSDDFTHDVKLTVSGDFYNDEERLLYSKNLCSILNSQTTNEGE